MVKVSSSIKIDGNLEDEAWDKAPILDNFIQKKPYNGSKPLQSTTVKILYSDEAIYIGAFMQDNNPDSIIKNYGVRDIYTGINSDWFSTVISTFDDGVNAVEFMVSASGIQSDCKLTNTNKDTKWDAVWKSAVKITDKGWYAELKIPYSALRFSKDDYQDWGIQFNRSIRRYREISTWNHIDIERDEELNQMGLAKNLENIKPPLRLSISPYISSYVEGKSDVDKWNTNLNAGVDLKLGINQSFTLDMILIPDFGQVQSDDQILNLTPFETKFDEKRPFFTEGTELFNKANILYTRRIGSSPINKAQPYNDLNENETIEHNPSETKLLNATKLSGRTDFGLGIGVLNAVTQKAEAEIYDTIKQTTRQYQTQGVTNYNMLVLDQSLRNNSYVSLVNTNVYYHNDNYIANVTGTEFKLLNKNNTYQIKGTGSLSQIYTNNNSFGHLYNMEFSKIKGNFRYELFHHNESDTYNPNDMGYNRNNNEITWKGTFRYNKYDPFWKVLFWKNRLQLKYESLYQPRKYSDFLIHLQSFTAFKKSYLHVVLNMELKPLATYDYFEPHDPTFTEKLRGNRSSKARLYISTDYRKTFAIDLTVRAYNSWDNAAYNYLMNISPRVRLNDNSLLKYSFEANKYDGFYGYINSYIDNNNNRTTHFGERTVKNFTNTLSFEYIFNNKLSLKLRARHYWNRVEYNNFYILANNGTMGEQINYDEYGTSKDINFNAFNIDTRLLYHFAPGSELSLVWKHSITTANEEIIDDVWKNYHNVFDAPQINSISFKLLYYIDYQQFIKG